MRPHRSGARCARHGPPPRAVRRRELSANASCAARLAGTDADLFGSQIQGDLIGASQWRIYQGVAKEFGSATSDSFP